MEYYLDFKRIEILDYATTWINLQDNTLSEISHIQKPNTVWLILHKVL